MHGGDGVLVGVQRGQLPGARLRRSLGLTVRRAGQVVLVRLALARLEQCGKEPSKLFLWVIKVKLCESHQKNIFAARKQSAFLFAVSDNVKNHHETA